MIEDVEFGKELQALYDKYNKIGMSVFYDTHPWNGIVIMKTTSARKGHLQGILDYIQARVDIFDNDYKENNND